MWILFVTGNGRLGFVVCPSLEISLGEIDGEVEVAIWGFGY